jgi:hypothetical protein
MNRRGFLGSILALGAAPAIVRADSLMRIVPLETTVLMDFSSNQLALSIDEFTRRYIEPAKRRLQEEIEAEFMGGPIIIRMPNAYTRIRDRR